MPSTCIGGKLDEQFPQDIMAPIGAPDYVIVNDTGWIIGTVSLDEMIENFRDTGTQPDGTMIIAPYCIGCHQPMYGANKSLCPECNAGLTF